MAPIDPRARARLGYLLSKIASGAPAPASGSAAAAVVATSAALLQKVALRSQGRWNGAEDAHQRAEALRTRAEELIEAFFTPVGKDELAEGEPELGVDDPDEPGGFKI